MFYPPLKSFLRKHPLIYGVLNTLRVSMRRLQDKDIFCTKAKVTNKGYGSFRKLIRGSNNQIIIGQGTCLRSTLFHIIGHNNRIIIGDRCTIGKGCSFWMEGNNITITIGSGTTFTLLCHFNAQENGARIDVGEDCMFSNKIIVRTSDSHPIYDMSTGKRINSPKPVVIGKHVWIAPDSKIMKGAIIGDGCIIGSNTMVSKHIPENSLAVGMPAKVVKEGIKWTREDIIFK